MLTDRGVGARVQLLFFGLGDFQFEGLARQARILHLGLSFKTLCAKLA